MTQRILAVVAAAALAAFLAAEARPQQRTEKNLDKQAEQARRDFLQQAARLATLYERDNNFEKAKEMLKMAQSLAPADESIKKSLERLGQVELTKNVSRVRILATQPWQDTGLKVRKGMPVRIEATGSWTLRFSSACDAGGIDVPKEMREFPLGAMIGAIHNGRADQKPKPFLVGTSMVLDPPETGLLYLKIHDSDESDNQGSITIQASGYVEEVN